MSFDLEDTLARRRRQHAATAGEEQARVFSVLQLNTAVREILQTHLSRVWVAGEVSDYSRPRSGHVYFTLKDSEAQVRAIIWRSTAERLRFDLEDGMQILCEAELDLYAPRGSYQLIVRKVEPQGVGGLQLSLKQLHARLQKEGLFDADRKRPLPRFPQRIAVVTSPTGAAVRDFLHVVQRRWRGISITIVPTRVQGADAAAEIADAIRTSQKLAPDVMVVTRGGGSLEDLWAFNDEKVVRAVAQAKVPVVSAVGHEIDVTLCDHAADVRALTPSEAGERVVPLQSEFRAGLRATGLQLHRSLRSRLGQLRIHLDSLRGRGVLRRPTDRVHDAARRVDELQNRLQHLISLRQRSAREKLSLLAAQVESLSPLQVLSRGYSLTMLEEDGKLVQTIDDVSEGQLIRTSLASGKIISVVQSRETET